jgi:pimeloyl-ACP methyl ester carboxylesterase
MPTIEANGETLHYVKSGAGPAVVFVHYLGGFSRQWQRQIAALEDRFTCIAFDQRGYGFSSLNGRWSVEASAEDLKAGLDALGIEAAHFVAYSMAGPVMLSFNARWSGMVRSLMLIDTFARNDRGAVARVAETEKCLRYMSMREYARQYTAARLLPETPQRLVDEVVASICLARKEAYLDTMRGILGPDFSALCPLVTAPTLVLCGRLDVTTPVDQASDLTRLIPKAREAIIEAAHLGIWENPEAFDRIVVDFLDAQEAAASTTPSAR